MAKEPIRLVLTKEHFEDLVNGKVVEVVGTQYLTGRFTISSPPVEIILQDIGFNTMMKSIVDAAAKQT